MAKYDPRHENAAIIVKNRQTAEDSGMVLDLDAKGIYLYTPGRIFLTYPDLNENGQPVGTTAVTVLGSHLVVVQKAGMSESKMVFEEGKTHGATYDTPFGSIDVVISACEVTVQLNETGGMIRLHYYLEMSDGMSMENQLEMQISML